MDNLVLSELTNLVNEQCLTETNYRLGILSKILGTQQTGLGVLGETFEQLAWVLELRARIWMETSY